MPGKKRKMDESSSKDQLQHQEDIEIESQTRSSKRRKKEDDKSNFPFNLEWKNEGELKPGIPELLYFDGPDARHAHKMAGFDIDSTIIKTKSGKKFATGRNDWTFFDPSVPSKLKELDSNGVKIGFFTNQGGIEKGNAQVDSLLGKFEDIIKAIGIPIQVFVSTGSSHYRKPSPEMWLFAEKNCNGNIKINLDESMYVGDAGGRPKDWVKGKSKDFSCSDRMFAANVGVAFHTPEKFFQGLPEASYEWNSYNVKEMLPSLKLNKLPSPSLHSEKQEIVVLVGCPASGKSTLTKNHFISNGYVSVNRDTLGTKEKCIKAATNAIKDNKSIIVDNTNPKVEDRKVYIDLAKQHNIPARCIYLKMEDEGLSHHLNMYRQNKSKGTQRRVPIVAYRTFQKYFVMPEKKEGFNEVISLDFVPAFDSSSDEELFQQWTCM
jgi:bifunctional polynucleotide phosphatase/kinase